MRKKSELKILIIGATSAIAEAVARHYATQKSQLFLVARQETKLAHIAHDLTIRGASKVDTLCCDLTKTDHAQVIEQCLKSLSRIDIVLLAHGVLTSQPDDLETVLHEINTNFTSHVSLLTLLTPYFEAQQQGCIAVISSVAGDRGRQSNYVYGSTKAGLSIFLQGLRNRLHSTNVQVLTIKPAFVDTPMTHAFKKGLLWSTPSYVAKHIVTAIEKKRQIIYTPWFWRYIMLIIRMIPERIFCKMTL